LLDGIVNCIRIDAMDMLFDIGPHIQSVDEGGLRKVRWISLPSA
jgi:hypothetical protein